MLYLTEHALNRAKIAHSKLLSAIFLHKKSVLRSIATACKY